MLTHPCSLIKNIIVIIIKIILIVNEDTISIIKVSITALILPKKLDIENPIFLNVSGNISEAYI